MKTILLTGATDGIGLETAKRLAGQGHTLLLHGRNEAKLAQTAQMLAALPGAGRLETYVADLSDLKETAALAEAAAGAHERLDVLINNAGIFKTEATRSPDGLDVRFAVNTVAPYLLAKRLRPLLGSGGRVINLSSAAQAPVNLQALAGQGTLPAMEAYAQSKLALTMWSLHLAGISGSPVMLAVNPGSLLASKMVREGFGVAGNDLGIGAAVLQDAALSDSFAKASGQYFDNDTGGFAQPHPDALDPGKRAAVVKAIEAILAGRV
ncbi:oxidoreductase [Leisingera sp. ANG-M1]|uniref:SDR family NAD(P)-dependent oxidoreductase n=1 Tax=Leisingera sp. ANG-M1 TaxID=1577895 RepID=UPI0005802ACC|nr:SDR family NAD(P)-dependent oxidoreductase [Leisingera sp. ANG-M1]KIC11603.1 oxidoreductase [Leisingera sp. ANG-M1]